MPRLCLSAGMFLALTLCSFSADPEFKATVEKAPPPAEVNDALRTLLSDETVQIQDGKDAVVCVFWFRKEIPAQATAEQIKNGLTYREIPKTTFIGVIQLPQKWIDFRKQEIPAGIYTLRFGMQPMDGDHMGTAPHTEFCLLSPVDKDIKADVMEMKAAIELSGSAHGSTHPAVLLLFPNSKPNDQPSLANKGNGIWVLNVKRPIVADGQKGTLGFGLTVAGHTME